jgi:hypothetical protein
MAGRDNDQAHLPNWLTRADSTCWDKGISIFLAAAFPVFLIAVWTVISPGWKDTIKFVTGRSWSHRIRRALHEAEEVRPTWITQTGRFLGDIIPHIDHALWFMAFREGVVFGLSHFFTMAYKVDPCPPPGHSSWGVSDVPIDGHPGNFDWQPGPTFVTQEGTIVPFLHNGVDIPPNSTATYTVSARFAGLFGSSHLAVDLRIVDDRGHIIDSDSYNGVHYDDRFNGPSVYAQMRTGPEGRRIHSEVRLRDESSPLVYWADSGHCMISVSHN